MVLLGIIVFIISNLIYEQVIKDAATNNSWKLYSKEIAFKLVFKIVRI